MKNLYYLTSILCILLTVSLTACGGNGNGGEADEPEEEAVASTSSGDAANGEILFNQAIIGEANALGCAACHSLRPGITMVGPSVAGLADIAGDRVEGLSAEEYLRQSIIAPNEYVVDGFNQSLMPLTFGEDLTEEEVNDLVAYMLTLEG